RGAEAARQPLPRRRRHERPAGLAVHGAARGLERAPADVRARASDRDASRSRIAAASDAGVDGALQAERQAARLHADGPGVAEPGARVEADGRVHRPALQGPRGRQRPRPGLGHALAVGKKSIAPAVLCAMAALDLEGDASPRSRAGSLVLLLVLVSLAAGVLTAIWLHSG